MKPYRVWHTITYARDIEAETLAEAMEELAADYSDEDITDASTDGEEITREKED